MFTEKKTFLKSRKYTENIFIASKAIISKHISIFGSSVQSKGLYVYLIRLSEVSNKSLLVSNKS